MVGIRLLHAAAGSCGAQLLVGFMLVLWVARPGAVAGEPTPGAMPAGAGTLDMLAIPTRYRADGLTLSQPSPAREFQPHFPRVAGADAPGEWKSDGRLLQDDDLGQRLAGFRSRGRVRLMTLWETGGSSLSLQAGHHGNPSVQWTSHGTSHGEGARGLLDELLNMSLGGLGKSLRWMAKAPRAADAGPPSPPPATAGATAASK